MKALFPRPLYKPLLLILLGPALLLASPALAKGKGDRIIGLMDRSLTSATDQSFEYEMVTRAPGSEPRSSIFSVKIKGDSWRRLHFKTPGDIKGMGVLILSLSRMFVYLPAYRKVRRVASHVRDQGFMGSAFSHDDMSVVTYADKVAATRLVEDATHWTVDAARREGSDYRYPRLQLKIRKDNHQPEVIRYYNAAGVLAKSEKRSDFECKDKHCNPKVITLTDQVRGGVVSTLTRLKWKVNSGTPDSHFTVRALLRGR